MKRLFKSIKYNLLIKTVIRIIVILFFGVISLIIPILLYLLDRFFQNYFGGEVICAILGLSLSTISIVLIINELKDAESNNCCEMLSKMNMAFIENERLMFVYKKLDETYRNPNTPFIINNDDEKKSCINNADLVAYFTFYEVMYEYIKHNILDIAQMDNLFGDRFFKLIHNSTVQKEELYTAPSSYANIFQLYNEWIKYREKSNAKNKRGLVVSISNRIPQRYLDKELYFQEKLKTINEKEIPLKNKEGISTNFIYRRLYPDDYESIKELQDNILISLDNNNIFKKTSKDEFLDSALVDYCYGLYHNNSIIALCICVTNRKDKRNLCSYCGFPRKYNEYITLDSVMVKPGYRGFGIQKFFINEVYKIAEYLNVAYILATVSNENTYSMTNFVNSGFKNKKEIKIYESTRCLMIKNINYVS